MIDRVNWPEAGKYVLAVSGGVDSMVLLDLMAGEAAARGYELTVAHFDHGIRADSAEDAALVRRTAAALGLGFVTAEGRLGAAASEAAARAARHEFLGRTAAARGARLMTAHHRDDLLETSLLNLARGTGRRGLAPMADGVIARPLLALTKTQLYNYARRRLEWREDTTNADLSNPRNFLRRELLPRADAAWRAGYLVIIDKLTVLNVEIDADLADLGTFEDEQAMIPRTVVRNLSQIELTELILYLSRALDPDIELDNRLLVELALFAKTGRPNKRRPIRNGLYMEIDQSVIIRSSAI